MRRKQSHRFRRAEWNHVFDQADADSPDLRAALRQVIAFLDEHTQ